MERGRTKRWRCQRWQSNRHPDNSKATTGTGVQRCRFHRHKFRVVLPCVRVG